MVDYRIISGILATVLITLGGAVYLTEDDGSDVCALNGKWIYQSDTGKYRCEQESKDLYCFRLSNTNRTCYIGVLVTNTQIEPPPQQLFEITVVGNGKTWDCEGTSLYSICHSGNKQTYYGEL